jgi:hypothetical protein
MEFHVQPLSGIDNNDKQPQHQVPLFSLQDMRFFQHFLLNCYPHYPLGSQSMWTHDIPCLSEKAYATQPNPPSARNPND